MKLRVERSSGREDIEIYRTHQDDRRIRMEKRVDEEILRFAKVLRYK